MKFWNQWKSSKKQWRCCLRAVNFFCMYRKALKQHLNWVFFKDFHWKYVLLNLESSWLSLYTMKKKCNYLASKLQKLTFFGHPLHPFSCSSSQSSTSQINTIRQWHKECQQCIRTQRWPMGPALWEPSCLYFRQYLSKISDGFKIIDMRRGWFAGTMFLSRTKSLV